MQPNFAEVYSGDELCMIEDAYRAITLYDLWDWLKHFQPHPNEGFMFSLDMNLVMIRSSLQYSHSGASFVMAMRIMQSIARNGWDIHRDKVIQRYK